MVREGQLCFPPLIHKFKTGAAGDDGTQAVRASVGSRIAYDKLVTTWSCCTATIPTSSCTVDRCHSPMHSPRCAVPTLGHFITGVVTTDDSGQKGRSEDRQGIGTAEGGRAASAMPSARGSSSGCQEGTPRLRALLLLSAILLKDVLNSRVVRKPLRRNEVTQEQCCECSSLLRRRSPRCGA